MNAEQQVIKGSALINRLVIDRRTTENVGHIDQLWLDAQSRPHHVVGIHCKSGFLGNHKKSFAWTQITNIGSDSIMVSLEPDTREPQPPEEITEPNGNEVWTDVGNKAGKLLDYIVARKTGEIVSYLFASSGWHGVVDGTYLLSPDDIVSMGKSRVIVADAALQNPQQYTEGMSKNLERLSDLLQEDYEKTMQELQGLVRGTQSFAEQAKDKAAEFASHAQAGVDNLKEKAAEFKGDRPPEAEHNGGEGSQKKANHQ